MARDRLSFASSDPLSDPAEVAAASIGALLEQRSPGVEVAQRTPLIEWALQVPEQRSALSFERYPFQRALYSEEVSSAREVVVLKAAQCGLSAWAIRLALWGSDLLGWTSLFCFPTESEMRLFSSRRLRTAIRGSDYLLSRMPAKAVDSVEQKQVGLGWVEFRGMSVDLDAVDADLLVLDEFSRMDPARVAIAEARVSSAESAGLVRRLGVPDVPGAGIAAAYDETSDARVWQVKCGCGHWNPIHGLAAWEANVDTDRALLVCAKCRRRLDVSRGEWVAQHPDRDVIGFSVPKLLIPGLDLRPLIRRSQATRPYLRQAFMTRDLGVPHVDGSQRLSIEDVRACEDRTLQPLQRYSGFNPVVMGVDVGGAKPCNITIEEVLPDGRGRKLWVGEIQDLAGRSALEQLARLMVDYQVWLACIDRGPEYKFAEAFAEMHPERVYRVSYVDDSGGGWKAPELARVDDARQHLSVWRTAMIENTIDRFQRQQIVLPALDSLPEDYGRQLGNSIRVIEERGGWKPVARFVRSGGDDDYLHCEVFCFLARALLDRIAAMDARALPTVGEDFEPIDLTSYGEDNAWRYGLGV